MSIEAKHAYRFGYLKSDKWKAVRLEALVREKGKCQICGDESVYNDAHHIWYPHDIYDTSEVHLVILCRACHELLHALILECKTGDEEFGRATWIRFRNAIDSWRRLKADLVNDPASLFGNASALRNKYKEITKKYHALHSELQKARTQIEKLKQKG